MWNWELPEWPSFSYDEDKLRSLEQAFLQNEGEHFGTLKYLTEDEKINLHVMLIEDEAITTSLIEGEILDRESVRSSILQQFGLEPNNRNSGPAEHGIATMMFNLYRTFDAPLSEEYINNWHKMLMSGRTDIDAGIFRTHKDPMQVVSGAIGHRQVHFEAPPSLSLDKEMVQFVDWFNNTKNTLPILTRAGIAHLYFVIIHPYEDGNGRIARTLSTKALEQGLGRPTLLAMSETIQQDKKGYYSALVKTNKSLNITSWLQYFGEMAILAQQNTQQKIDFIIQKTKLYDKVKQSMNPRQEKVIRRMFQEGLQGFIGGLSAENYISITNIARATATRDLAQLVENGFLFKTGELRHTRYYLDIPMERAKQQAEDKNIKKTKGLETRQKIFLSGNINQHVQGSNDAAPVLQKQTRSKPMASNMENIKITVEDLKKREVLFSYAATFDKLAQSSNEYIKDLSHQKTNLMELEKRVAEVVSSSFIDDKDVQQKFDLLKPTKQKEMLQEIIKDPKKVGKVKKDNTLDMLKTQNIEQDFIFHTERRVKSSTELAKVRKEISKHAKHVWKVAKGYGLDAKYNEFVKAKTPADKMETRLVKGYLKGQLELNELVRKADEKTLAEAKSKGAEYDKKLKPHTEIVKLQVKAEKQQANVQKKRQAKTQVKSQKIKS